jgi:hypothetical protein
MISLSARVFDSVSQVCLVAYSDPISTSPGDVVWLADHYGYWERGEANVDLGQGSSSEGQASGGGSEETHIWCIRCR